LYASVRITSEKVLAHSTGTNRTRSKLLILAGLVGSDDYDCLYCNFLTKKLIYAELIKKYLSYALICNNRHLCLYPTKFLQYVMSLC
jgi:hypothetical protein